MKCAPKSVPGNKLCWSLLALVLLLWSGCPPLWWDKAPPSLPQTTSGQPPVPLQANLWVALLIDKSASMLSAPRLTAIRSAVPSAGLALRTSDRITLVAFSSQANVLTPFISPEQIVHSGAYFLSTLSPSGTTETFSGISVARRMLIAEASHSHKHILLISDGKFALEAPRVEEEFLKLRSAGISLSTVGFGEHTDSETLKDFARRGQGVYYQASDEAGLAKVLKLDLERKAALAQ